MCRTARTRRVCNCEFASSSKRFLSREPFNPTTLEIIGFGSEGSNGEKQLLSWAETVT